MLARFPLGIGRIGDSPNRDVALVDNLDEECAAIGCPPMSPVAAKFFSCSEVRETHAAIISRHRGEAGPVKE